VEASERSIPTLTLSFPEDLLHEITALPRDMLSIRLGRSDCCTRCIPKIPSAAQGPELDPPPHRRRNPGWERLSGRSRPYCGSISVTTCWTRLRIRGRASFLRMFI
jgi:hypothetical protein